MKIIDLGVDALCIGPNDLSGSAGLLRQHDHPTVRAALDRILATAKARGLAVCTGITLPADQQSDWISRGARMALVSSDVELLSKGTAHALGIGSSAAGTKVRAKHVTINGRFAIRRSRCEPARSCTGGSEGLSARLRVCAVRHVARLERDLRGLRLGRFRLAASRSDHLLRRLLTAANAAKRLASEAGLGVAAVITY